MAIRKDHPKLGKYKWVMVHPKLGFESGSEGFVGINLYEASFKLEQPVQLPEIAIEHVKNATFEKHVYNKEYEHEDGRKGRHETESVKMYIVELLPDLDEADKLEAEGETKEAEEEII